VLRPLLLVFHHAIILHACAMMLSHRYVYGDLAGFVYIWATAIVTKPGSLAIICLVCGEYSAMTFGLGKTASLIAAYISLALVSGVNAASVKWADRVNRWFTVFKSVALVVVGLAGAVSLLRNGAAPGTPAGDNLR
jgi:L-asparagine transporter-like permease